MNSIIAGINEALVKPQASSLCQAK